MDIATSFMPLLQVFTAAMTEPTGESFKQIVAGWIFAPRKHITGAIRATNPSKHASKHHSAYHRVFASARWSIDQVGLAVFDLVVKLTDQSTYYLVGDDTLIHKTGLKVYGAGMHLDACQSLSGFTSSRSDGGTAGLSSVSWYRRGKIPIESTRFQYCFVYTSIKRRTTNCDESIERKPS